MTKSRLNLRKVAKIGVACLAVCVMFAACGKESSDKKITAFSFSSPSATGVIDEKAKTIIVEVPNETNVTALVPTITVSEKATVSPASGVAQNFTSPVTYTVTAEDGSTADYVVTIKKGSGGDDDDDDGDDDGDGNSNGKGEIEIDGKKYPLNKAELLILGNNAPFQYHLELKKGGNQLVFVMNGTSGTELATGTYTQFIGGIAALVVEEEDKESFNELGALFEPTVIVTKSGADFEINATGYIYQYQYQPNQKKLDVKATWKGKIEVEKY